MDDENIGQLLNELAEQTADAVRPGLAEDIKERIPERIPPHRGGMDTVNIIIDLRVGKLAAAAAIVLTTLLFASFLNRPNSGDGGMVQETMMVVKHFFGGQKAVKDDFLKGASKLYGRIQEGKDVVYYSDIDSADSNAVLMHWKISDDTYGVILGDFREKEVSAEELVRLQARMLQGKGRW